MNIPISIITVSFNSESTISKTIESVLYQTLVPHEYLIIDGLSSDSTVRIAETYRTKFEEKGIKYTIVSEKDFGIYDAMNKGIRASTGKIIGMINSDDWYEPKAIKIVSDTYKKEPFDLFYANLRILKSNNQLLKVKKAKIGKFLTTRHWNHPTTFITKKIYDTYQYNNKTIYDDWDLIIRLRKADCTVKISSEILANFKFGGVSNEKSFKKTIDRIKLKYMIYRQNNCSPLYLFDCIIIEFGKYILG